MLFRSWYQGNFVGAWRIVSPVSVLFASVFFVLLSDGLPSKENAPGKDGDGVRTGISVWCRSGGRDRFVAPICHGNLFRKLCKSGIA